MKSLRTAAIALGALAMLTLGACSNGAAEPTATPTDSASTTEADLAVLASIGYASDAAGVPQLTFVGPLRVGNTSARVVNVGGGEQILEGQLVTLSYTITSGLDGEVVYSSYDNGAPETIGVVADTLDPTLYAALIQSKVGGDILFATFDGSTVDPLGATGAATIFMAIHIDSASTPLTRAQGTAVAPVDGLPVVTLADNGAPSIDLAGTTDATELTAQTLIAGDGAVVEAGQTITANYSGWLLDGTQFDSSWGRAPLSITLAPGSVIQGWTNGLVGQTVGSQVLLIIPAELGYGDAGQGDIPGGATLVFVVDILAVS